MNKKRKMTVKILFGLGLLLALFQNCSQPDVLFRSDEPVLKIDFQNNGDGYLGKPPAGSYVRSFLEYNCPLQSPSLQNLQGQAQVKPNSDTVITDDNCQNFSYLVSAGSSRLDYFPYNPDFFGFNAAIYERFESFSEQLFSPVESFCRVTDLMEGWDIVARLNPDKTAQVKIYKGEQSQNIWLGHSSSYFPVQRLSSPAQIVYQSTDFKLTVEIPSASASTFTGRMVAQVEGRAINKTLSCRMMRNDSVFIAPNPGLVSLWQMNDNWFDISGFNNHILAVDPNNSFSFQTGIYNQAVQMGNPGARLQVAPSASLDNLPRLSITTWVWPADDGLGLTHGGLVHKSDRADGITQGWQFHIGTQSLNLGFEVAYSGQRLYVAGLSNSSGQGRLRVNQWNHVAVTWDGTRDSSRVRLYINGIATVDGARIDGVGARVDDSHLPVYLGDYADVAGVSLNGRLDQTAIWNRELTPQEIMNLYNTGTIQP